MFIFSRFHAEGDQSGPGLCCYDQHLWVWKGLLPEDEPRSTSWGLLVWSSRTHYHHRLRRRHDTLPFRPVGSLRNRRVWILLWMNKKKKSTWGLRHLIPWKPALRLDMYPWWWALTTGLDIEGHTGTTDFMCWWFKCLCSKVVKGLMLNGTASLLQREENVLRPTFSIAWQTAWCLQLHSKQTLDQMLHWHDCIALHACSSTAWHFWHLSTE